MVSKNLSFRISADDADALKAFSRISGTARTELKKAADAFDQTQTAGKRMAQGISKVADDVEAELKGIESASVKLGAALGPDLAKKLGQDGLNAKVIDLRQAGLTFGEIEADADSLAGALKRVDDIQVGARMRSDLREVEGGLGRVGTSAHKTGDEVDRSRGVLANFVGNAAQDIPGISGSFGALNVAVGQFAEYATEGGIAMSGLLSTLAPIAVATTVISVFKGHLQDIAETKAFNRAKVDDFVAALREGETVVESLRDKIIETGKVEFRIGSMKDVKDLAPALADLGLTVEDYLSLIEGGSAKLDEWTKAQYGATAGEVIYAATTTSTRDELQALADQLHMSKSELKELSTVLRAASKEMDNQADAEKRLNDQHRAGIFTQKEQIDLGGQYRQMAVGVMGANREVTATSDDYGRSLNGVAQQSAGLFVAMGPLVVSTFSLAGAGQQAAPAIDTLGVLFGSTAVHADAMADAAKRADDRIRGLADTVNQRFLTKHDIERQNEAISEAITDYEALADRADNGHNVTVGVKDGKGKPVKGKDGKAETRTVHVGPTPEEMKAASDAARDLEDQMVRTASATADAAVAQSGLTDETDKAAAKSLIEADNLKVMVAGLDKNSPVRKAIEEHIKELEAIPKEITSEVRLKISGATVTVFRGSDNGAGLDAALGSGVDFSGPGFTGATGAIITRPVVAEIGHGAKGEALIPLDQAPGAYPLSAMTGNAGGDTYIQVDIHVAGSVISESQLIDVVHQGLLAKQQRTPTLGFRS